MAKLSDLKALLVVGAGGAAEACDAAAAPARSRPRPSARSPPPSTPMATSTSRRRSPTSSKLAARNRAAIRAREARTRAAPHARRRARRARSVQVRRRAAPAIVGHRTGVRARADVRAARASAPMSRASCAADTGRCRPSSTCTGSRSTRRTTRSSDFIVDARTRRLRCVRVIHGKGLTSPNKEPVLKGKVRRWLAHWDEVLAYTEAPRHAGGSGARPRAAQGLLTPRRLAAALLVSALPVLALAGYPAPRV